MALHVNSQTVHLWVGYSSAMLNLPALLSAKLSNIEPQQLLP